MPYTTIDYLFEIVLNQFREKISKVNFMRLSAMVATLSLFILFYVNTTDSLLPLDVLPLLIYNGLSGIHECIPL